MFQKIPNWVKNTGLLIILLGFCAAMTICAYNKETDKTVALAGIFAAILCSNIFNVRAEIEKYRIQLSADRKLESYSALLSNLLRLKSLYIPVDNNQAKDIISAERKREILLLRNAISNASLYLSEDMQKIYDEIMSIFYRDTTMSDRNLKKELNKKIKEMYSIARKELDIS